MIDTYIVPWSNKRLERALAYVFKAHVGHRAKPLARHDDCFRFACECGQTLTTAAETVWKRVEAIV